MYKKLFALIATVVLGVSLSACQLDKPSSAKADEPASLVGNWVMTDGDDDFSMTAKVTSNDIKITWLSAGTKALYWKGTFTNADSASEGTIVSHGDRDVLDSSILGSMEKNKEFEFDDGKLSYEMSVMNASRTITLEKQ